MAAFLGRVFACLSLAALMLLPNTAAQAGPFETEGDSYWVVLSSRENLDDAIAEAKKLQNVGVIVRTEKDIYAVVARFLVTKGSLDDLRAKYKLPDDSFITRGKNFVSIAWPVCKDCYMNVARGLWNDGDGAAHAAAGVGYGRSYEEAANKAMRQCRGKGRECELSLKGRGTWNGGCMYVSLGNGDNGTSFGVASTRKGALASCRENGAGYDNCGEPFGGCSNEFPD